MPLPGKANKDSKVRQAGVRERKKLLVDRQPEPVEAPLLP